jgi:hypothetical protein
LSLLLKIQKLWAEYLPEKDIHSITLADAAPSYIYAIVYFMTCYGTL